MITFFSHYTVKGSIMSIKTRMKTFTNPNHKVLEMDFNMWSTDHEGPFDVVNTTLTYSSSLQKFILAVVYTFDEDVICPFPAKTE